MCVGLNFIATDVVWNETGQSETFQTFIVNCTFCLKRERERNLEAETYTVH